MENDSEADRTKSRNPCKDLGFYGGGETLKNFPKTRFVFLIFKGEGN